MSANDGLSSASLGEYSNIEKSLPNDYDALLNPKETQRAISKLKVFFEGKLCERLNLIRVESPLIIKANTGMTENVDRENPRTPISFKIVNNGIDSLDVEVTQAATKWKRWALKQFDCEVGEGVLADMRAIRQDEFIDTYHNSYVDQWDWEKVMTLDQRNLGYLNDTVKTIWEVIKEADKFIRDEYPILGTEKYSPVPNEIKFLHAEDLLDMYPNLTPDERETEALKKYPAIFLYGIGMPLQDGKPHGTRTADYDDWITPTISLDGRPMHGLNGDILVWNPVTRQRYELSSMAIRVTKETLRQQLEFTGQSGVLEKPYYQMILNDEVPLCIGGGIGESRIYMYLLRKAALGECSVNVWPQTLKDICAKKNIFLLE